MQVLQECFEKNAYPKDDELEALSRLLDLSPRVIVVWFQNARQKVRKSYENHASTSSVPPPPRPSLPPVDVAGPSVQLNGVEMVAELRCDRCSTVFGRHELAAHRCRGGDDDSVTAGDGVATAGAGSEESDVSRDERDGPASENDASQSSVGSEPPPSIAAPVDHDWTNPVSGHVITTSGVDDVAEKTEGPSDDAAGRLWISDDGGSDDPRSGGGATGTGNGSSSDKRMRTTILPEQLDYLYHKYQADCNPSRKQLDAIAAHVGLKKRVVQVWFQNTRARERKGQYRAHQQLIHKRCPFCKALFRARTALEAHLATKHPDEMARSDITVDNIPDELVDTSSRMTSPVLLGLPAQKAPPPPTPPTANGPFAGVGGPFSGAGQVRPTGGPGDMLQANMQRLYEDSFRRYIDELSHASHQVKMEAAAAAAVAAAATSGFPDFRSDVAPPSTLMTSTPLKMKPEIDAPLDLSTSASRAAAGSTFCGPEVTCRQDDARSESRSETNDDFSIDLSCPGDGNSEPASPSAAAAKPPSATGAATPMSSAGGAGFVPNKRYRTQMSSMQIRVMKSIFADYRTPTMSECEVLGREISLPRRVVQVSIR